MVTIWQQMVDLLSSGEDFVMATIFDQSGSAPRTAGAKMIVQRDGTISGTVGGGRLEGETRSLAETVINTKTPVIQKFNLSGSDAAQMDMICGGQGEVLLDYIEASQVNLKIYQGIVQALQQRKKAWLITGLGTGAENKGARQQCLVKDNGTMIGTLGGDPEFINKLISGPAKISIHSEVMEDQRLFFEPIRNTGTLIIFGAGHVSQKIAPIAELVGFKTVVLDDREEYASRERFPASEIMLLPSFANSLPDLSIDRDSYLVIVTRGHLHDKTVLGQVLTSPAAYIGMIGSRRKRDMIYNALKEEQGFEDEHLARVYAPIGTDILAETPEEIAVSIVAELIKVRAEKEKCVNITSSL